MVHSRKSAPGESPGGGGSEAGAAAAALPHAACGRKKWGISVCSGRQDASEQRSICRAPQTDQRPSRAISLVTFLFEHKKVTLPPKAFSKKHPFSNFLALICHSFYKNEVPVAARAYLSCSGKKGSKEAGRGGFELCAPAHKSHSK